MVYFLPTMNGSGRFLYGKCKVNQKSSHGFLQAQRPWPTSNVRPPWWPFHRRRPAPWCWHMHMLASGHLNFWRLGSWGFGKLLAGKEGRKGGGRCFLMEDFFLLKKRRCLFFLRKERGMDSFGDSLNSCALKLGSKKDDINRDSATIHSWIATSFLLRLQCNMTGCKETEKPLGGSPHLVRT